MQVEKRTGEKKMGTDLEEKPEGPIADQLVGEVRETQDEDP